jgi:hypothetical protein
VPQHDFILKISYFHFKLTSWRCTTSYHASQLAVIVDRHPFVLVSFSYTLLYLVELFSI